MSSIQTIGVIHSNFNEPADPFEMRKHESTITIEDKYREGLFRLEENRYIQIIFQFHLSTDDYSLKSKRYHGEVKGVFASRSPFRPSAVGVTTVELLKIEGTTLTVKGLDAVDGTPLLDIKPYTPVMDENEQEAVCQDFRKRFPREEITRLLKIGDIEKLLVKAGELHGHFCPGVSSGVMAAAYGLKQFDQISDGMEDILAIVETNNCFSDGVQYVTGCTFGNNSLIYRDFGKTAVTITDRDAKGIRIAAKNNSEIMERSFPRFRELFEKVVKERNYDRELLREYKKEAMKASFGMLTKDFDSLFTVQEVSPKIPLYAPMRESIQCDRCGENVMAGKTVDNDGRSLCLPCSRSPYNQLIGEGIICGYDPEVSG